MPVSTDLDLWICSPRTVVKNLLLARRLPRERLQGSRIVNLPGITVSIKEMLEALRAVGGDTASGLIDEKLDDATQNIVKGWPTRLDTSKAKSLGYSDNGPLTQTIREYIEDYGPKSRQYQK